MYTASSTATRFEPVYAGSSVITYCGQCTRLGTRVWLYGPRPRRSLPGKHCLMYLFLLECSPFMLSLSLVNVSVSQQSSPLTRCTLALSKSPIRTTLALHLQLRCEMLNFCNNCCICSMCTQNKHTGMHTQLQYNSLMWTHSVSPQLL